MGSFQPTAVVGLEHMLFLKKQEIYIKGQIYHSILKVQFGKTALEQLFQQMGELGGGRLMSFWSPGSPRFSHTQCVKDSLLQPAS